MTYRSTFLGLALAVIAAGPAPANAQTATAPVISAQPQDQIWHLRASSVIFTI